MNIRIVILILLIVVLIFGVGVMLITKLILICNDVPDYKYDVGLTITTLPDGDKYVYAINHKTGYPYIFSVVKVSGKCEFASEKERYFLTGRAHD